MYLEVRDVKKSYGEGGSYTEVLKGITTSVEKGQQQRCAIARALVKNPKLLLCDEPAEVLKNRE